MNLKNDCHSHNNDKIQRIKKLKMKRVSFKRTYDENRD